MRTPHNVGLSIQRLDEVPIPVDVHIARASLATGIVRGRYDGGLSEIYERIRRAWAAAVAGLKVGERPMTALDVDEPLWHLSKLRVHFPAPRDGHMPQDRIV